MRAFFAAGAFTVAAAIAAGAFGAHALDGRLDPRSLDTWKTGAQYLAYGGFGVLAAALAGLHWTGPATAWSAGLILAGAWIFGLTVGALALGGPRWLGAVTPLGGLAMIVGFLVLGWAVLR